jgi:hypothetical protein
MPAPSAMENTMTIEQIQTLPIRELRAIVRSTNPAGKFWLEMTWARDELARRKAGAH